MQGDAALAFDTAEGSTVAESTDERSAGTRLARASDHLEEVLVAVVATDRAHRLQTARGERRRALAREIKASRTE